MITPQIEPCPFCNSYKAPQLRRLEAIPSARYIVICHNCSARGPGRELPEIAVEAWNRHIEVRLHPERFPRRDESKDRSAV